MFSRAVYIVFALSGISGLLYQVIWVRWFGRLFGNTVFSASIVISVFMFGLGVGSYLVGIWIDRNYRRNSVFALKMYAYAEIAIAVLGTSITFILPILAPFASQMSSYTPDINGWHELTYGSYAARVILAIAILAPVTTIMGGTLTLLIRYVLTTELNLVGWRIGLLYGFNTAGAALGAFLSDFALIPSMGLYATQMVAVSLNLVAALWAMRLAKSSHAASNKALASSPRTTDVPAGKAISTPIVFTAIGIFMSGFCAMGIEIFWFRYLSILLGGFRSVFSILLTVILICIWLGSMLGGYCHRRFGHPKLLYMLTQTTFVFSTIVLLLTVKFQQETIYLPNALEGLFSSVSLPFNWVVFRTTVILTAIPAVLMGFSYPLANANIQQMKDRVGQRAGFLYLANTIGAVLGSACSGLVFMPMLGMHKTVLVLAGTGLLSIVAIYFSKARKARPNSVEKNQSIPFAVCIVAVILAGALWIKLPTDHLLNYGIPKDHTLMTLSEGVYEVIAVTTDEDTNARNLLTNGHAMSNTTGPAQRYMRAFTHIPLLHMKDPKKVLVICFGVGSTLHAASLHETIEEIEVVDLSRHVLEHAKYFAISNHNILENPKVNVFINDGRQHLRMQDTDSYDLVTLEPPPIGFAGVSALYSKEFYELAKSRLRPGGFMSQWLPAYQVPKDVIKSIIRAFIEVFPSSILLSGSEQELILIGTKDSSLTLDLEHLIETIKNNPALKADLKAIHLDTPTEIVGSFLNAQSALKKATQKVLPISDDYPIMEYSTFHGQCKDRLFPMVIINLDMVTKWCPGCFKGSEPDPSIRNISKYFYFLTQFYNSKRFKKYGSCPGTGDNSRDDFVMKITPDDQLFNETSYLGTLVENYRGEGQ
jgi:spermidine synthase